MDRRLFGAPSREKTRKQKPPMWRDRVTPELLQKPTTRAGVRSGDPHFAHRLRSGHSQQRAELSLSGFVHNPSRQEEYAQHTSPR